MNKVSLKVGNGDETLSEEGIKSMSFEKDWDPFLEALLLKKVSRAISLFRKDSFLGNEISSDSNERTDVSLQKIEMSK